VFEKKDRLKYYEAEDSEPYIMKSDDLKYGYGLCFVNDLVKQGYQLITSEEFMQKFPPPEKEAEFVNGERYEWGSGSIVVVCTGKGIGKDTFSGVVISGVYDLGNYDNNWIKSEFKPLNK